MNRTTLSVFLQLLRRDLLVFRREYPGKLLDTCFLFFTNLVVFTYLLPLEGMKENYGPFIVIGAIGSFGLFEVVGKVSLMMSDIEGDKTILQTLIMPIRSWAVFCYIGIFWTITSIMLTFPLFFLAKLLLWDRFDLAQISYFHLIVIYLTINLFYGFFALWITSVTRGMSDMAQIFIRFINPMWMFGAYFYSWGALFGLNAWIAYISLINPMVYAMEGIRGAVFGQEGYLPFWNCVLALWVFISFLALHAIYRLKKRLDCV